MWRLGCWRLASLWDTRPYLSRAMSELMGDGKEAWLGGEGWQNLFEWFVAHDYPQWINVSDRDAWFPSSDEGVPAR